MTLTVDMRDVYPPHHWAIRGEAPGFDTPDEDVYLDGRNVVLLGEGLGLSGASRTVARADRPARRQPVSGCHARVLRRDVAARCRWDSAAPIVDRSAVRVAAQGGRDQAGSVARSAVRADAVVHAAERRTALRPLQQVPRAERWVSRSGYRRSDPLPGAAVAVGCPSSSAWLRLGGRITVSGLST